MIRSPRFGLTLTLGSAQTLAWASSYYLPAILAVPMTSSLGQRQGLIIALARAMQALPPLLFGLLIEQSGAGALWLTSGVMLVATIALLCVRVPPSSEKQFRKTAQKNR